MATSDNVIRAGLTPKLRDVPNLLSGLTYTASPATKHTVKPSPFKSSSSYVPQQEEAAAEEDPFADPVSPDSKTESILYDPPIPEFSVVRVQVATSSEEGEVHAALRGPSIFIVTRGSGQVAWSDPGTDEKEKWTNGLELVEGRVVFVGAGTAVKFICEQGGEPLEVYRAFVEPRV